MLHKDTLKSRLEELSKWHGYNAEEIEGDESLWNDYEFHKNANEALTQVLALLEREGN